MGKSLIHLSIYTLVRPTTSLITNFGFDRVTHLDLQSNFASIPRYISEAESHGLMKASMDTGTPVIFGVFTCLTELQAQQPAGLVPGSDTHGVDWAKAAVECAVKKGPMDR